MTAPPTSEQLSTLRSVAALLIPGSSYSPTPAHLLDFDELLGRAVVALGPESKSLPGALHRLPSEITWDSLSAFAVREPVHFEIISTVVSGAYFMSPTVLESIGYPTGPRKAPPFGLAAEELEGGILDPVIERGPFVRPWAGLAT